MFSVSDAGLLLPNKGSKKIEDVFTSEEWGNIKFYWTIKKEEYSPPLNVDINYVGYPCRIFLRPKYIGTYSDLLNFFYDTTYVQIQYSLTNVSISTSSYTKSSASWSWSGGDICIERTTGRYYNFYENQNLIISLHFPNYLQYIKIFRQVFSIYSHILILSSPSNDFNTDYQTFQKFVKEV